MCPVAAGYEVQTIRIATQPFDQYLTATNQEDLVASATTLERLAKCNGVPLLSIGSSSTPQHLRYIPAMVAATSATSCSFALGPEPSWEEAQAAAEAVVEVARLTGKINMHQQHFTLAYFLVRSLHSPFMIKFSNNIQQCKAFLDIFLCMRVILLP